MSFNNVFQRFFSYFFPVKLNTFHSEYSGKLFIYMVNGKKILDTSTVNYSFNSLHRVFKKAFAETKLNSENKKDILILGLGGGSIVDLLRTNHQITGPITAVEIDPVIIEVAKTEFNVHQFDPINIVEANAEAWIKQNIQTFDIICVDLFINAEVPSVFLNPEFIDQLLRALNNNGIIYFNIMIENEKTHLSFHSIYKYLLETSDGKIKSVNYIEVEENNRVLIIKK